MIKSIINYLLDQYDLWRYSRYYRCQNLKHRQLWESSIQHNNNETAQYRDEIEDLEDRVDALSDENRRLRRTVIDIQYQNAARRQTLQNDVERWHAPGRQTCLEWGDAVEAMQAGCKCYPVAANGNLEWEKNAHIRWDAKTKRYMDEAGELYEPAQPTYDYLWRIVEDTQ